MLDIVIEAVKSHSPVRITFDGGIYPHEEILEYDCNSDAAIIRFSAEGAKLCSEITEMEYREGDTGEFPLESILKLEIL